MTYLCLWPLTKLCILEDPGIPVLYSSRWHFLLERNVNRLYFVTDW